MLQHLPQHFEALVRMNKEFDLVITYQSIPSLTIPLGNPGDSHIATARGVGFSPNFICPGEGGRGFEIEKFSTVLKGKMQELLNLFQRNWRQLEKQVFLCCFIPIFAKTVDVFCILGPFSAISMRSSRVILMC